MTGTDKAGSPRGCARVTSPHFFKGARAIGR